MLYQSHLKEVQQQNSQPQSEIQDSLKGVNIDYFFIGKRQGSGGEIEFHVTSFITDWATNTYTRKSIYRGHKEDWRRCIEKHIIGHLKDLNTDPGIIRVMMRYFEYRNWKI